MPIIDIIVISNNSEKWIKTFFQSLESSVVDLSLFSLLFIDNASTDNSLVKLNDYKKRLNSTVAHFTIVPLKTAKNYSQVRNHAVKHTKTDFIFFLDTEAQLLPKTLSKLIVEIKKNKGSEIKSWELRNYPIEQTKNYNPLTGETSWFSSGGVVIEKSVFKQVNGFDSNLSTPKATVDISWRILLYNYKIRYLTNVLISKSSEQIRPGNEENDKYETLLDELYLRNKFGSIKEIIVGVFLYFATKGPNIKKRILLLLFIKNTHISLSGLLWRISHRDKINKLKNTTYGIQFKDEAYGASRIDKPYINRQLTQTPLVSVIVRSYNRHPNIIRETLTSLINQTYKNFEVILVEDGTNNAKDLINNEFKRLSINYIPLEHNKGRSIAGNIGMAKSKGQYINFLDDDDLFFNDHLETLVGEITQHEEFDAVYSKTFATPITITSQDPYTYKEHSFTVDKNIDFNKLRLINTNYLPIQSILFKKDLFKNHGGFDETIDYHEDWDLWIRYMAKSKFKMVNKVTSIYRIPHEPSIYNERENILNSTRAYVKKKNQSLELTLTVEEANTQSYELIASNQPYFTRHILYRTYKAIQKRFYK
jgi:glycosyltransferase involved in cell wall biosynthesis